MLRSSLRRPGARASFAVRPGAAHSSRPAPPRPFMSGYCSSMPIRGSRPGGAEAAANFVGDPRNRATAGVFRFALDARSAAARRLERAVAWRYRALGIPYGDQGLLIHRAFLAQIGGIRPLPIMEDVDLVRRIGRARLTLLPCAAVTSAARFERAGYSWRSLRNLFCLALYFLGLPPRLIVRIYG